MGIRQVYRVVDGGDIMEKDKQMIRHALYDIHEYADILAKNHKNPAVIKGLAEMILDRVEQITEAIK